MKEMENQIENQKMYENKTIQWALEEYPEFKAFTRKQEVIDTFIREAEEASSHQKKADNLEIAFRMQKSLFEKMLSFYILQSTITTNAIVDAANETKKQFDKVYEALKTERQQHEEFYDEVALSFTIAPKETFEFILKHIERKMKTESADGFENWQWTMKFPGLARLRMAWRLLFGSGLKKTFE